MKRVMLLTLAFGFLPVLPVSQAATGDGCGTVLTPEDVAAMEVYKRAGTYDPPSIDAAAQWYIPIAMLVVRRSNGTGGLSDSRLSNALDDVNGSHAAAGMLFYRSGPTRYIDSDDFYLNIDTFAEINALRQTDVVPGTVNLYFTENLAHEAGPLCGISSFTTSLVQGIVMKNACTAVTGNRSTTPHEVGHYFDLYHTHETMFGAECVRRTPCSTVPPFPPGCLPNCSGAGDLLCDTAADPGLSDSNVDAACAYTGTERDGPACGDVSYMPDPTNLMSFAPADCRDAFTTGQGTRSRATLENLRNELAAVNDACATATFVNAAFPNGGTGTPFFPYDTFAEGVQAAPDGGCVVLGPGNYAELSPLTRPMRIHSPLGVARIGN